jgi:small subunit ribosomal protein S4
MGDPRRLKKKYKTPMHPWQRTRIEEESSLSKEYGLKNKREIWKMKSKLQRFTDLAKRLMRSDSEQALKERAHLLENLYNIGLTKSTEINIDDALSITAKDLMERRLQTLVYKKGLANTMKKARQFISHSHILVGDRKITSPGYIVSRIEEDKISIVPECSLASPDHPERTVIRKEVKPKDKKDDRRPSHGRRDRRGNNRRQGGERR